MADKIDKLFSYKVVIPDGTVEATGNESFIARIAAAVGSVLSGEPQSAPPSGPPAAASIAVQPERRKTIRDLYQEKRPNSDSQTVALIAFYLSEVAGPDERADTVDVNQIIDYFKKCPRELPAVKKNVLVNAKAEGYVDSAGYGKYKLSAIGYNLVVHSLPSSASTESGKSRR